MIRAIRPPQAPGTQYFAMDVDEVLAAVCSRPDRLLSVSGPQERILRHTVEHDSAPDVPSLDVLVSQMGDELVEVPNVVSQAVFQQHSVEQTVDFPVHGGVERPRGGPRTEFHSV